MRRSDCGAHAVTSAQRAPRGRQVKTGWESLWSELCPTNSGGVEKHYRELPPPDTPPPQGACLGCLPGGVFFSQYEVDRGRSREPGVQSTSAEDGRSRGGGNEFWCPLMCIAQALRSKHIRARTPTTSGKRRARGQGATAPAQQVGVSGEGMVLGGEEGGSAISRLQREVPIATRSPVAAPTSNPRDEA